ncbi:hypothetical protein CERZMDRAFT_118657 [Cercospora zeae-maydis SCOH1-5]|uniref:Zn(2)-C6 fungal-type domain-containing protein n=1 Tax=Cercospora zeae-maydis SCOH1-5 TaxID=717836 RepID=A0A6A6F6Y7_9PEZI|nr:hypothetical protein CERZMDRAFT_118657 [Cercospora zeae-maydis SCOH1-5]
MSDEGSLFCLPSLERRPIPSSLLSPDGSTRKLRLLSHWDHRIAIPYPSPPMSNPPSPRRLPQHEPASPPQQPRVALATQTPPITSPSMPVAVAFSPAYGHLPYPARETAHFHHAPTAATIAQPSRPFSSYHTTQPRPSFVGQPASFAGPASSSTDAPTGQRGGRKSKAHVASACINCKRAHLSCDVNRPCSRCVSTGRQDTCFDVQHKKRGRPRLRDDANFKVERMVPDHALPTPMHLGAFEPALRNIATPRSRRAESFRSLRSEDGIRPMTSEGAHGQYPESGIATGPTFQHQFPPDPSDYEVPTAFLDMDLVIQKANGSFCQIMSLAGAEAVGCPLSDVVRPLDGEGFAAIRAAMRIERESRDPSYMPPIVRHNHDPLDGAMLVDVDRYTEGAVDRVHTWTQINAGHRSPSFPARVRLARMDAYFVAITLPSFRPAIQPSHPPPPRIPPVSPPPLEVPQQMQDRDAAPRHYASLSAPSAPFLQPSMTAPMLAPLRTSGHHPTRSYPPPQPPLPYQRESHHFAHHPTPDFTSASHLPPVPAPQHRMPPSDRTSGTQPFLSQRIPTPPPQSRDLRRVIQLPPILTSAAPAIHHPNMTTGSESTIVSGPSSHVAGDTGRRSDDVSGGEERTAGISRSPSRKRRKLDLDDVLHKN